MSNQKVAEGWILNDYPGLEYKICLPLLQTYSTGPPSFGFMERSRQVASEPLIEDADRDADLLAHGLGEQTPTAFEFLGSQLMSWHLPQAVR